MGKSMITLAISVFVAVVMATPISASSSRTSTLTGTVTNATSWCCGTSYQLQGRGVLPKIGAVSFTGNWTSGTTDLSVGHRVRFLTLELVSPNGDGLTVQGATEWDAQPGSGTPDPALLWSFRDGTGRFSAFSGGGTYTVTLVSNDISIALTTEGR